LIVMIILCRRRSQSSDHNSPVSEPPMNAQVFDDYQLKDLTFATYTGLCSSDENPCDMLEMVPDESDLWQNMWNKIIQGFDSIGLSRRYHDHSFTLALNNSLIKLLHRFSVFILWFWIERRINIHLQVREVL
jgi:hypothetical protein